MLLGTLLSLCAAMVSCGESTKKVVYPLRLHSPYPAPDRLVFAVTPPRNESGVSTVDELAVGDALAEQFGQVKGIDCLPLNRTLSAMRALNLASVGSPGEARALARALGADAVVVSTISSWQPYQPPRIGLSLALFGRSAAMGFSESFGGDVRGLTSAASPVDLQDSSPNSGPLSDVSLVLDASNTAIMAKVQEYGEARVEPNDPMGWERYSKSMKLYTQFACHRAVEVLLERERIRLSAGEVNGTATTADQAR